MKTSELEARVLVGESGSGKGVVLVHAELCPAPVRGELRIGRREGSLVKRETNAHANGGRPVGDRAGKRLDLLERVDVHEGHPVLCGPAQLLESLRVAVEDEGGRWHAGGEGQLDVAHRHYVDERTLLPGDPNNRGLGIGLGCVHKAASLILATKRAKQRLVVVADRSLGDHPERGSVFAREDERIATVDLKVPRVARAYEVTERGVLQRHRRSLGRRASRRRF
jgi:hypothetical protein